MAGSGSGTTSAVRAAGGMSIFMSSMPVPGSPISNLGRPSSLASIVASTSLPVISIGASSTESI